MTVKSVVSTVLGFLEHYASEASAVSGGFNALIDALPLSAQDKMNIRDTLKPVFDAPAQISEALKNFEENPPIVHINAADIQNAVASFLSTALPSAVANYMRDNPTTTDLNSVRDAVTQWFAANPVMPVPAPIAAEGTGQEQQS